VVFRERERRGCGDTACTTGHHHDAAFGDADGLPVADRGFDVVNGNQAGAVGAQGDLDTGAAVEQLGRQPFCVKAFDVDSPH
jgi:hypothetical protein